jgi:hypothetical protein
LPNNRYVGGGTGAGAGAVAAGQTANVVKSNQPGNFNFQNMYPMLNQLLNSNRQPAPQFKITIPKFGPKEQQYKGPQLSTGYRRMLEQRMK